MSWGIGYTWYFDKGTDFIFGDNRDPKWTYSQSLSFRVLGWAGLGRCHVRPNLRDRVGEAQLGWPTNPSSSSPRDAGQSLTLRRTGEGFSSDLASARVAASPGRRRVDGRGGAGEGGARAGGRRGGDGAPVVRALPRWPRAQLPHQQGPHLQCKNRSPPAFSSWMLQLLLVWFSCP